jgi:hypothetical protein
MGLPYAYLHLLPTSYCQVRYKIVELRSGRGIYANQFSWHYSHITWRLQLIMFSGCGLAYIGILLFFPFKAKKR